MRIVAFGCENASSSWHRIYMWMEELRKLGNDVFFDADRDWSPEDLDKLAKGADFLISGRPDPRLFAAMQVCRDLYGCKIIIDTDDLVSELSRGHPAGSYYHSASGIRRLAEAMYRKADAVTVSTRRLKRHVSEQTPYVYHMPNSVSPEVWKGVRRRQKEARHHDDFRIYWGGGGGHYGDLQMVREPLIKLVTENPRIKLIFQNFIPDWAVKSLPITQVFYMPVTEFHGYYKTLAWVCADIAIAPLEANEHNLCKSNIKYLEYAMAGIPGVYSNVEPYACVIDGVTGMVAGPDEWYAKLKRLIDDGSLRYNIVGAARNDVIINHNIDRQVHRYQSMLLEIAARKKATPVFEMLQEGVSVKTS